jgi:HSP90 family molecular chaperone
LHGVIDSPDIPLNVSRSYLQSDSNVKKISGYITRKVAERLNELFTSMRAEYEQKWDDLKIFIQYGILTDEKFAEKAAQCMLWKNTEGKYFTAEEYCTAVKDLQTDKDDKLIILYTDDIVGKHSFLQSAKAKGYDVLEMNGQLDSHYINWYEQKNENTRFVRVDSDIIDHLIRKKEEQKISLSEAQQEIMRPVFEAQLPTDEDIRYNISFEAMSADDAPIVITQNEFMRRMKDMAKMSGGQMRRAAIAGVLAMEPEVLILDEPAAGLDPGSKKDILDLLDSIRRETGTAIVLISHDMDDIADYADRMIVLHDGTVAREGRPQDVFSDAEAMQEIGIGVPEITSAMDAVRRRGIELPFIPVTADQAVKQILELAERSCAGSADVTVDAEGTEPENGRWSL